MSRDPRRRHGFEGLDSLDEMPLDGGGVRAIEPLQGRTPDLGPGTRLLVDRPVLDDGRRPARRSATLASELALEPRADAETACFEWDGVALRAQVRFPRGTSFYGAGLIAAPLLRNGRTVVFWNTDAWRYGPESPSLYQSHPFVLAVRPDGSAVGVLADSPRRGQALIADDGVELAFEAEPFDLLRLEARHPATVVATLSRLVGRACMPPAWALGYHQCRWGWDSAEEVLEVAREMRARSIPCDALWLDIQHMDRCRPFSFDPERFPDPEGMLRELRELGLRTVAIVDPGLPADPTYAPSQAGLEQGHFVRDAQGHPVRGRVWPGLCHFPDFTRAETRAWWAGMVERFALRGLDGIWNDMNEPSVFRVPTRTLPESAQHAGDDALPPADHARYHNLYGQLMAQATREGLQRAYPDRRPFVLTRAGHLGTARHAATWTGDNQATWDDLRLAIPMVLSLGLCGQSFSGPDLGGFDGDPDGELFARWFELGALLPLARGHSHRDACRKEPWSFGAQVEERVRRALELRHELLPLLYTLFAEAALNGAPVARPVFFADPTDPRLRAIDDAFLLGEALLVAPIVEPGSERRRVVLPRGGWYALDGDGALIDAPEVEVAARPGRPPTFVRSGTILPTAPTLARAADLPAWPLLLPVFLDQGGRASGLLYQDDGESVDPTPDRWRVLAFRARPDEDGTRVDVLRQAGELVGPPPRMRAIVHHPWGGPAREATSIAPAFAERGAGRPWWGEGPWREWGE